MALRRSAEQIHDNGTVENQSISQEKIGDVNVTSSGTSISGSSGGRSNTVPLKMKIFSILMVSAIGFGSHWSSGVTGAMKSTLKKVRTSSCLGEM
jgi:hypothetical protein